MERARAPRLAGLTGSRAGRALRRSQNWIELAKFTAVGASGYLVNLAVYVALVRGAHLHYLPAAVCSFAVAVTNNYWWNRHWTFRHKREHFYYQGLRFLVVSVVALGANLLILRGLVAAGLDKIGAQAIAIILVTPLNFIGNRLWSFAPRNSGSAS
jgi:dolichol-phosphate mannosyltransferase